MSRDSQGLHGALIVFTTLTTVLGVLSAVFFRQSEEALGRADATAAENQRLRVVARTQQEEIFALKQMIGVAVTTDLATVRDQFNRNMNTCAAVVRPEHRFYEPVLQSLQKVTDRKNGELRAAKEEIQQLKDVIARLEPSKHVQVVTHRQRAEEADAEFRIAEANAREQGQRLVRQKTNLYEEMLAQRHTAEQQVGALKKQLSDLREQYDTACKDVKRLREKLDEYTRPQVKTADGRIREISTPWRTAWVDLGRADEVETQRLLTVYNGQATWLNDSSRKGEIIVTRILDDHLAEARILDDEIANPIVPGDKVFTSRQTATKRPEGMEANHSF